MNWTVSSITILKSQNRRATLTFFDRAPLGEIGMYAAAID
jgi:hypothetical protein